MQTEIIKIKGDWEEVCNSLASDEAIEEVFDQVGVKIAFEKPQRMEETKGVWR